jgi:hypothetical protein
MMDLLKTGVSDMANTFAPNGFAQYSGAGSAPTYEQTLAAIVSSNTTPIFLNDPVMQAVNTTGVGTGYIQQAYSPVTLTVSTTGIATVATGAMTITFTALTCSTAQSTPTVVGPTFGTFAAPVGAFVVVSGATGVPNGVFTVISSTTSTVVVQSTGVAAATSATSTPVVTVYTPVAGVFAGCKYLSTAQKRTVWSNYWPGSDTSNDVEAYVITDPNARFIVQTANSNTTATAVGQAQVGQNIGFAWSQNGVTSANGNTANGLSTMFADQYTLSSAGVSGANAALPFRVIALANYLPGQAAPLSGVNGNDATAGYNKIVVGFNNAMPRNFAGV